MSSWLDLTLTGLMWSAIWHSKTKVERKKRTWEKSMMNPLE